MQKNRQHLDKQNIDKTIGWEKMSKFFQWAIYKCCLLLNEHKMSKGYIDFPDKHNIDKII